MKKEQNKAIFFLQKVHLEIKNYRRYGSPLSDDVKQFALRISRDGDLYFSEGDATEMIKEIKLSQVRE